MSVNKEMNPDKKMAEAGEFLREYGKQYFVVATEAFSIGRIKWNMVPIGKNGKNAITFYIFTKQMISLCSEILDGTFEKKLEAEKSAYPSAYKYTTGTDGHLRLNIGKGKAGCCIQLQDNSKKLNYLMAVSLESLKTMARMFFVCIGLAQINPNSYYSDLFKTFEDNRKKREVYYKNDNNIEDITSVSNVEIAEEIIAEKASPDSDPIINNNPENKTENLENFKIVIKGKSAIKNGFLSFAGKNTDNEDVYLLFSKEDADNLSWFNSFKEAAIEGTTINIRGEKRGKFIRYSGPAK